jgi:hypothetical protein
MVQGKEIAHIVTVRLPAECWPVVLVHLTRAMTQIKSNLHLSSKEQFKYAVILQQAIAELWIQLNPQYNKDDLCSIKNGNDET